MKCHKIFCDNLRQFMTSSLASSCRMHPQSRHGRRLRCIGEPAELPRGDAVNCMSAWEPRWAAWALDQDLSRSGVTDNLWHIFSLQQFPRVTSIGTLPPKTLGKSRVPPQRPRRTLGETPRSPLRDPRRALWEANFLGEPRGGLCPSDGVPPEL